MFQALRFYWGEVMGDKHRERTFAKVARTLARMDAELGVLDTPEEFGPLCKAGKGGRKLEGFSSGAFRRAEEWMETGLTEELETYKK